uniref:Uncharacterized protein n=1 Tax=viral metagenome TaxID=1070528 RepID=A0A6C0JZM8_9ZZZZ
MRLISNQPLRKVEPNQIKSNQIKSNQIKSNKNYCIMKNKIIQ